METIRSVVAGIVLLGVSQAATAVHSLCQGSETTYFSCSVANGKIISLCGNAYIEEKYANDWIEPDNPWLQYRFGLPHKIELTYPSVRKDSLSKFYGDILRAQGGSAGWDRVLFVSGSIAYGIEYVFPYDSDAYHRVRIGDPKKLEINVTIRRKTAYPEADLHCTKEVDDKRFNELVRFLFDRQEMPSLK